MKSLKQLLWFIILMGIAFLFLCIFGLVYTPAGQMGEVSNANKIASVIYLIGWIVISILSGFKNYKTIVASSIIYSALPLIILLLCLTPIPHIAFLIIIVFVQVAPVQGVNYYLVFGQLPIFLIGYVIGIMCKKKNN